MVTVTTAGVWRR